MAQSIPLLVTAAVIRRGDHVLIAQRKADSRFEASKWEFPGGKVEVGEHPEDGLKREIREELDLEIRVRDIRDVVSHVYQGGEEPFHVVLLFYDCLFVRGEMKLLDVQDARWVELRRLGEFEFAAADVPVVQDLLRSATSP